MTALRRRLVPYGLLLPGTLWLLLFFAVPMYFMGEMALRSGSLDTCLLYTSPSPRDRS